MQCIHDELYTRLKLKKEYLVSFQFTLFSYVHVQCVLFVYRMLCSNIFLSVIFCEYFVCSILFSLNTIVSTVLFSSVQVSSALFWVHVLPALFTSRIFLSGFVCSVMPVSRLVGSSLVCLVMFIIVCAVLFCFSSALLSSRFVLFFCVLKTCQSNAMLYISGKYSEDVSICPVNMKRASLSVPEIVGDLCGGILTGAHLMHFAPKHGCVLT